MRNVFVSTALLLGLSSAAQATVTEPNGLVVPIDSSKPPISNGETQIYTVLQQRDPALDWQRDSDTQPEVFSPLCSFTAELILRQTASSLAIGWYNVDTTTNNPPAYNQIYQIIPAGAAVGTKITGTSIKDDTRYKGGLIGFALMKGNSTDTHYSEKRLNINCTDTKACPTPGPWITSITYISKTLPNTFFLGFEDGGLTSSSWSNDGDFNDYVFQFTGLTCQGGGKPCTVPGINGICAAGVTQCQTGGGTTCKQILQPEPTEKCDGLDNDCNGMVDDGATCPNGLTCDRGRCVELCGGEFLCPSGLSCDSGRCVEPACVGVSCAAGTSCKGGTCTEPCAGIVCPGSQICRVGRCVDACAGVTCPTGQVCQGGACIIGCDCYPCGDPAQGCSKSTNLCVASACVNITCPADSVCQGGQCVSACQGAVCPDGQTCTAGNCVDVPPTAMPDGGSDTDGDTTTGGAVAVTSCGCRLVPSNDSAGGLALGTATLFIALGLRRRRRLA
jgi:hypothetical protein